MTARTTAHRRARRTRVGASALTFVLMSTFGLILPTDNASADSSRPRGLRASDRTTAADTFAFTPNAGQTSADVLFMMHGHAGDLLLTKGGLRLTVRSVDEFEDRRGKRGRRDAPLSPAHTVTIRPIGATLGSAVGLDQLPGRVSYFFGGHPSHWRTDLPRYGRVVYRNAYPGVDLAVYGRAGEPEYDFIVQPGADPNMIELAFEGAAAVNLDAAGDLILSTKNGSLRQRGPVLYQQTGSDRIRVEGRYILDSASRIKFAVGEYDKSQPLIIDPQIVYQLGGLYGRAIATDSGGNAYIARSLSDVAVRKLDDQGVLVYEYLIGPTPGDADRIYGIAVNVDGSTVVTGEARTPSFPTTEGVINREFRALAVTGFVAKVNSAGNALVYSTFLGGNRYETPFGVRVDEDGNAYVTGATASSDFPTTGTAYQPIKVTDFWSTNAFLAVLNPTATALVYSTYFGGTVGTIHTEVDDQAFGIAFDTLTRDVYITGMTDSADFPTTLGVVRPVNLSDNYDCFVARFRPSEAGAASLVYSTLLGGNGSDGCNDVAVDGQGSAYLAGGGDSDFFPPGTPVYGSGIALVAKLSPIATEVTYGHRVPGGSWQANAWGIAVADRKAYVTGNTSNTPPQLFVRIIDPTGSTIVGDYTLSSPLTHQGLAIAVDTDRNVYVTGSDTIKAYWEGPSPVKVLSTTTRWKPQRSDDTMTIDFEGPEDVDVSTSTSGTLEIQGPVGPISFVGPIVRTSTSPPFTYRMQWTGPWTYIGPPPTNDVKRLPAANYPTEVLVTTGIPPNQQQARSATYDRISLVEVNAIAIKAVLGGSPVDDNPGPGGGRRMFAEAVDEPTNSIPEPTALDVVGIALSVEPPVYDPGIGGAVLVGVKALDVDDPWSTGVDDESPPCMPNGCDNRGVPQTGKLSLDSVSWFEGSGGVEVEVVGRHASAFFRSSWRHGDNYRIAAGTSAAWLLGLSPAPMSTIGEITHAGADLLPDGVQVSTMLTVWRTLRLEVDRLVAQDPQVFQNAFNLSSYFTALLPSTNPPPPNPPNRGTILNDASSPLCPSYHPGPPTESLGGWVGANVSLAFHPGDVYNVTSNSCNQLIVTYQQPDMTNGLTAAQIALLPGGYTVSDEKVAEALSSQVDYSLASSLFALAYIRVLAADQTPSEASIAFSVKHRNVSDFFSMAVFPAQKLSARTYWSVSLYSAFEGKDSTNALPNDFDPRNEAGIIGLTSVGHPSNNGSYKLKCGVFMEAIRDLYEKPPPPPYLLSPDIIKRNTAHELLHAFFVHHTSGVMCPSNIYDGSDGASIALASIGLVRSVEKPTQAPNIDECP